ncbi:MAG TPA: nucleotide sugar dehydrogenase [Bryobacteraceae bacterium]|nr:nucleotide sugar dehydrogenase [Bryobacteraceae bacterium]
MQAANGNQIAVLGLGYVGCVTAACLASLGHRVLGIDRDPHKVASVLKGRAPFYEPGLDALVREGVRDGRLSASTSAEQIIDAGVALVCVGTPSEKNGNLGLEQLRRAIEEIAAYVPRRAKPLVVAIRSTVFPGTCEEIVLPVFERYPDVRVVSNPEFLREGSAVQDFLEPSLVVVGGFDDPAVRRVADLYAPLGVQPSLVSLRTAEMIKYACNAFHAVKISFANEVGALSERLGIDAQEVMDTLCQDVRLNISTAYLKPGFAFGGSCLPKDLRALIYRMGRLDLKLPLVESTLASNEQHLKRAVDAVLDLPAQRIGVIGLAFKENTDDLRESPVVTLLEQLVGKGRDVRVFDPQIRLDAIYGSNRSFILESIPHIGRLLCGLDQILGWADHLVLAQKQSAETMQRILCSGIPLMPIVNGSLQSSRAARAG